MVRLVSRLGDRLLGVLAPKADAAAAQCTERPYRPPYCFLVCCPGAGCRVVC